jgi:hypothetical protein
MREREREREEEKCSPIYRLKNKDRFYHHYPIDSLNRNKPTDNFYIMFLFILLIHENELDFAESFEIK